MGQGFWELQQSRQQAGWAQTQAVEGWLVTCQAERDGGLALSAFSMASSLRCDAAPLQYRSHQYHVAAVQRGVGCHPSVAECCGSRGEEARSILLAQHWAASCQAPPQSVAEGAAQAPFGCTRMGGGGGSSPLCSGCTLVRTLNLALLGSQAPGHRGVAGRLYYVADVCKMGLVGTAACTFAQLSGCSLAA